MPSQGPLSGGHLSPLLPSSPSTSPLLCFSFSALCNLGAPWGVCSDPPQPPTLQKNPGACVAGGGSCVSTQRDTEARAGGDPGAARAPGGSLRSSGSTRPNGSRGDAPRRPGPDRVQTASRPGDQETCARD
uniref:Uncharacterized protein n=1 Tax=Knipowitschia caucasica TaxID=637954 RepID=A0AAV2KGK2_KNICA